MVDSPTPPWDPAALAAADHAHCWHPFTPMGEWMEDDPLILVGGEGCWLVDARGNRYLDANSSIWTNVHGHGHPRITEAIRDQAATLDHASFLGTTNPWAINLAEKLAALMPALPRVFFTDDGSTAVECALKMSIQARQLMGEAGRSRFVAFDRAYHGDTMGASSLGGVSTFFERFRGFGFQPIRCSSVEDLRQLDAGTIASLNAVVIEPLIQGVNRMHLWPPGMLTDLRAWCDEHAVWLVLDEVMTGFGRTGRMFACQHEEVVPDFLCLAKGLTGGTVPLAATLTSGKVFSAFLDDGTGDRTFYYGHSYCGNPIGCAAALASLEVFEKERVLDGLAAKIEHFSKVLEQVRWSCAPHVGAVRQLGLMAGIDLVQADGSTYPPAARMGQVACRAMREAGVLTRPILDTIVLMPPLAISREEINHLARGVRAGIHAATAGVGKV